MVSIKGILKGIVLAILSLLFFSTLTGVVYTNALLDTATNPEALTKVIDSANIFELVQTQLNEMVSGQSFGAEIPPAELQQLFSNAFSRDWFNQQIKGVLTNISQFIRGETTSLNASIDLIPVKQSIQTQIQAKYNISAEVQLPLPDQIPIQQLFQDTSFFTQAQKYFSLIKQSLLYGLIACIVLLALIFLVHRNLQKFLKWLGGNLIVSGAGLLVMAFLTPTIIQQVMNQMASNALPAGFSQMIQSAVIAFFNEVHAVSNLYGIAFIIVGIVLWIVGKKVLKGNESKPPPAKKDSKK